MPTALGSPIDFNRLELLNARLQNLGIDPSSLGAGDKGLMWITASGSVKYWDGTAYKTLGLDSGGDADTLDGQDGTFYLARGNHTGTQPSSTISDFTEAAQDAVGGALADTATLDLAYNDAGNAITGNVLDSPTVGGATPAQLRDRSTHTGTQLASTISNFDTQVRTSRLDQMAAPTAAVDLNGQKITGLSDGSATQDAATYGQLLAVIEGKKWKDPVRAATTANITLSGTQTIDGVALAVGDRVLVKNQTAAAANGIYVVASGAWTRTADANAADEVTNATVIVNEGTANQGDVFTQTTTIVTLGTTAQTWVKTGEGNQTYAADGTTLELNGSTFSIKDLGVTAAKLAVGAVDLTTTKVTGVAPVARGGTGHSTYAIGDLLFASATGALSRLAGIATGNALISGGVNTAPSWGKVGLTTHVSGTLPVANGGTGGTTAAAARTNLGATTKFAVDIGGGSTGEYVVTHNLGTRDVQVDVFRNSTPWDTVIVDIERTTINTVTIRFAAVQPAASFRVVVVG